MRGGSIEYIQYLLMNSLHPLQLHHPLIAVSQLVIQLLGGSLHQDGHGLREHRPDGHPDQDGDEDGADGVSDHPAKSPHQDGRDNHPSAAKCVSQDVEKDTLGVKSIENLELLSFDADLRDTAVFHLPTGDARRANIEGLTHNSKQKLTIHNSAPA